MNIRIKNDKRIVYVIIICSILIFSSIIYAFNLNAYLKNVSNTHSENAKRTNEMLSLLNNSAAQLLNNSDVLFTLNHNNVYDVFKTDKAIYITKTVSSLLNAESIYFLKQQDNLVFVGNRMVPAGIDDFQWESIEAKETIIKAVTSEVNGFFVSGQEFYYVFINDRNTAVIYKFGEDSINKSLFEGNIQTHLYYNGKYICSNVGAKKPQILNIEKEYNSNLVFKGFRIYVCDTFEYLSYATFLGYKDLLNILMDETAYYFFVIALILLLAYYLFRYILKKINKNRIMNETYFYREISEKAVLHLFLNSTLSDTEINEIKKLGLGLFTPVIFYINSAEGYEEKEQMLANYGVCNIMSEIIDKAKLACYSERITVGVVSDLTSDTIANKFKKASEIIRNKLNITVSLCIGDTYSSVEDLVKTMNQDESMIANVFLQSSKNVVSTTDKISSDEWKEESQAIYRRVISGLKNGDRTEVREALLQLYNVSIHYKASDARTFIVHMFLEIIKINNNKYYENNQYERLSEFISCQTLEESIEYILNIIENNNDVIGSVDDSFKRRVESIIALNYNDLDFNLSQLADMLNMNKTYVGRKFITVFDKNFTQYLAEFRVNKACTMLKNTTSRIEDIGKACGFNSASYFIKIFRNNKGITPLEYREMEGDKDND